jgi:hypothetical protein
MMTPFGVILILVGGYFFARTILVILGRLKSPLLHTFEPYTDTPPMYNSLRNIAIWLTILLFGIVSCLADFMRVPFMLVIPIVLAAIIAFAAEANAAAIYERVPCLMPLPGWYRELMARTTKLERRHLAYRWLALPSRARAHYNYNDKAFRLWADLVIASCIY